MGRAFAYAAFGRVFPGSGARLKRSLNGLRRRLSVSCVGLWRGLKCSNSLQQKTCESRVFWLGGRDSNPDNLLQRQMSYRWTTSQCESQRGSGENFRL